VTTTDYPRPESLPEDVPPSTVPTEPGADPAEGRPVRSAHGYGPVVLAGGIYLVLAVLLWWNVWTSHPTSTTTCGCGDSSLFTWFLAWPAYAISHGLNPLYSTAMFHPTGVNLLSNTAEVGFGVVLAPVTWLFGPIATLNVALTLSPALSALAMFVLLRRWVSWSPAAFAGGLLYGFSPFVLISLTDAHLMLGAAFVPPLMVLCLDEIFVRQRRGPVATGMVLGVLAAVQFCIGTESLVIVAIGAGIGLVLMVVYGWVRDRDAVRSHARHAIVGSVSGVATGLVLLIYPVWFAFAGPGHLSGSIWGSPLISYGGANLKDYFLPEPASAGLLAMDHRWGGYQAPTLSGQYFGLGLVIVLVVGCILWRRDRRLWLFGAVSVIAVFLSFGLGLHNWTLWRLFVRFPLMENVIPSRFLLVTYFAVAVMLALIIDHAHADVRQWWATNSGGEHRPVGGGNRVGGRVAAIVGIGIALIAIGPIAAYYSAGLPFTTRAVVLPTWYRTVAPTIPDHQVLLSFPVPFDLAQSAMTWQAVNGMHYSMVGGGGPDSILKRAGPERAGQTIIGNYSISAGPSDATPEEVTAVRHALDGWGVTMIVVPDQSGLPLYERVTQARSIVVLMTAATGQRPVRQAGAWVWTGVDRAGPPVSSTSGALARCNPGAGDGTVSSIEGSVACVLAAH
jgi:hypothetical protein